MKKRIGWLVIPILFIGIGLFVYNFFNEGQNMYIHENQEFSMSIKDIANIDDEIYVKYSKVIDNRCKEDDCEREGEKLAKLTIIHNPYISTIKLSSINNEEISVNKTSYKIKLTNFDVDSDKITIKVINEEK